MGPLWAARWALCVCFPVCLRPKVRAVPCPWPPRPPQQPKSLSPEACAFGLVLNKQSQMLGAQGEFQAGGCTSAA